MVKFLLQEAQPKADIRSKDNDDKTALDLATAAAEKEEGKPSRQMEKQREREMERRRALVALLRDWKEKQERDYDTGGDEHWEAKAPKQKTKIEERDEEGDEGEK